MPTLNYYLTEQTAPVSIPVDIVDYAGTGFAFRVYHNDIQELPNAKMEDFANWLIEQAKRAEKAIGLPVSPEVDYL